MKRLLTIVAMMAVAMCAIAETGIVSEANDSLANDTIGQQQAAEILFKTIRKANEEMSAPQASGTRPENVRYVSKTGKYTNDGRSWATAKNNVQDAINDLADSHLIGEVWVAEGTYKPTESTESSGGSTQYLAFKIPEGITVRGGFSGNETYLEEREISQNENLGDVYGEEGDKDYPYCSKTIFSGSLTEKNAEFVWDDKKQKYNTSFYGNSYHVVWFATNGFDENGRAKALETPAAIEGITIIEGYAHNTSLEEAHPHNAYGGGVYMVHNSTIENCNVVNCEASRNGGGIYMDGGGIAVHTSVTACQALGIGVEYGYGGGICVEAKSETQANVAGVGRSAAAGNVARMGGGIAFINGNNANPNPANGVFKHGSSAYSIIVANNVATTEAGGIYMDNGGCISNATVVRNRCNGSGVTVNGMNTGRSAGVYIRNNAYLANSVIWGGQCSANNNVEFASSRSTNTASSKPYLQYVSLDNSDFVDWSGVTKVSIKKLSADNDATNGSSKAEEGFPMFTDPTTTAGIYSASSELPGEYVGVVAIAMKNWRPLPSSALNKVGLQAQDADAEGWTAASRREIFDLLGDQFNPRATLGAYSITSETIVPSVDGDNINYYVDPERTSGIAETSYRGSWDAPAKFLSDVLNQIGEKNKTNEYNGKTVRVHVKEGTVDNTNSSYHGRVRNCAILIPDNVEILGGYKADLSGTSLDTRNSVLYPTIITGKITDDYDMNVAHIIAFAREVPHGTDMSIPYTQAFSYLTTTGSTLDGFQIRYANAKSMKAGNAGTFGAGVIIIGGENTIKNTTFANCQAEQGAALFISGLHIQTLQQLNTPVVNMENCIIHNNSTDYTEVTGNIYISKGSTLNMNHCNVLRNIGYAFINHGTLNIENSMAYANLSVPVDDTNDKSDKALPALKGTGTFASVNKHNLFDIKETSNLVYQYDNLELQNIQWPADKIGLALLTFTFEPNAALSRYPRFINPTKNSGVSIGGDITYYGKSTNFMPHNSNPMINTAYATGEHTTWGTDMSTTVTRDYGGLPDIGAVENHCTIEAEGTFGYSDGFPAYGTQWYVRDYGSDTSIDGRDGMSWATAINGNGIYNGVEGLQYAVNTAHDAFTAAGGQYGDEKEVWVGAGTYSRNPDSGETSCFVIKDGVKVYGAFPKTGNPGKEQREPLCSQYVKEINGRTVSDFETILQPMTASTAAGTTHRVLGQPYTSNPVNSTPTTYLLAEWDGFTLRNGVLDAAALSGQNTSRVGGAAATFYSNVTLRNMVATGNTTFYNGATTSSNLRGGAFYIDGGTLESSYVINNTLGAANGSGDGYGGGIYLYQGSVYNSVIANNTINATNSDGAGTAIFGQAISLGNNEFQITTNFFNNTVVNNTAKGSGRLCGGVAQVNTNTIKDEFDNQSLVNIYNCIVLDNTGYRKGNATLDGYKDFAVSIKGRMNINRCATENINDPKMTSQLTMSFTQCYATTSPSELFVNYNKSNTFDQQDFRLKATETSSNVINHGNSSPSVNGSIVDLGSYTDMDYNDRVLDCTIDMGAFEYDNAYDITPDLTSEPGRAIYYVTPEGLSVASASSPGYAACAAKLQRVLDAAGRYKYQHPETQVIVKIATRKGGGNEEYVKPGSLASEDSGKDDLNTIASQKQYLNGLEMVVEQLDGTTQTVQALSGMTFNKKLSDMYQLGENTVNVYAGKKVTFNFQFPSGYGGSGARAGTSCLVESIWIDTNGDKIFNQLLGRVGKAVTWTPNKDLESVTYTIPEVITGIPTRIRIRLETPWSINYTDANAQTNRIVYDIPIQVVNGTTNPASFQYYANRTVDEEDQDIRLWSIIVPRGVEVWGGYSDLFSTAHQNGFYDKNSDGTYVGGTDKRDILGNPVYFDASYYNKTENSSAITYHVVSFSDKVFDGNGNPYHVGDIVGQDAKVANAGNALLTMASKTTDRAVVDGIFIQGGTADANSGAASSNVNINQYGGAAIVTDYAHVRNCIVRDNKGFYGGAFALTHGALISGTLMEKNSADYGGALYVFKNGTKISNGTTIDTGTSAEENSKMPHIYTSTIVNNKANKVGGGIWFSEEYANVRVNSSVIWENECNDQANVAGNFNPDRAENETISPQLFYPFAYSAVQNLKITGVNNISLANDNKNGARFSKFGSTDEKTMAETSTASGFSKYDDFGYYGLTSYSALLRVGMPTSDYATLVSRDGLAASDFASLARNVGYNRTYIDIGARAFDKTLPSKQLMLRLYVAKSEDVNMDACTSMMNLSDITDPNPTQEYYSQEGSSFAYPFQSLQDALDYIVACRQPEAISGASDKRYQANNLPFEIFMAKGTYYPSKDLVGNYGQSRANTFAIPEGVSIYGGFDANELGSNTFYGRHFQKGNVAAVVGNASYDINNNVTAIEESTATPISGYTISQLPSEQMTAARSQSDINGNDIVEPWEFTHQTILSGNAVYESNSGVYHVVTVVPDQNVVGVLPSRAIDRSVAKELVPAYVEDGYHDHEEGQNITLDGLSVQDGYAKNYISDALDEFSDFSYYHGGALLVDGNRYNNDYNNNETTGTTYKHTGVSNAVGYRDIPVIINKCRFYNNTAGYGGAISANNTTDIFSSSFERNSAQDGSEVIDQEGSAHNGKTVAYPGQGGAIYGTHHIGAFNTLFANNEAIAEFDINAKPYKTIRNQNPTTHILGGCGGAIYIGKRGFFHVINCNVVRNQANMYPAVFTMNPNTYADEYKPGGEKQTQYYNNMYSQILNSVLWGNEVNPQMIAKYSANSLFMYNAPMIVNYGKHQRSADYDCTFIDANYPVDNSAQQMDQVAESAWFSAYEENRGSTQKRIHDLRDFEYVPFMHPSTQYAIAGAVGENCNITISSDNHSLEGPAFGNPSTKAGLNGYFESADWAPTRLNKLTDQGSGKILQIVALNNEQTAFESTFPTYTQAGMTSIINQDVRSAYSCETLDDYVTQGAYTTTHYLNGYTNYNKYLTLGDEKYMMSVDGTIRKRISYDPNPTHDQTFIDIGVYEYLHTPLSPTTEGDECDVLWVSNIERPENGTPDGSSWLQPTSDLQRAIETLLSSRNGHRKEIRLMEGEYTPIYTIEDKLAFFIDTQKMNASVVPGSTESLDKSITSFTIKGGYSKDLNGVNDLNQYSSVLRGQLNTNEESDRWDYLFYIKDASNRTANGTDAAVITSGWTDINNITTIPIQFDGVTFINQYAKNTTNGSAIHYESVLTAKDEAGNVTATYTPAGTSGAYITTSEEGAETHTSVTNTSPAKVIMSKCKVMNSTGASAVDLGDTGGNVLIYNTVFHSNEGKPLVAGNATTINNTIALNGGETELTGDSKIFNSVFWKNNTSGAVAPSIYGAQFTLAGYTSDEESGEIFANNAYTGGNTEATDYNEYVNGVDGEKTEICKNNYNVGLTDSNTDAIYGPNFKDPENTDVEARNFDLMPSLRLLNQGNNAKYNDEVVKNSTFNTDCTVYEYAWNPSTKIDAMGDPRIVFNTIDLGAYEYQSQLNRIFYVDPTNMQGGNGLSWNNPLGNGNIQAAIDLAAVYYKNNRKQAYVLVKAANNSRKDFHTNETLTLRNGVSIYGSVNNDFNNDCPYRQVTEGAEQTYDETLINAYLNNMTIYHRNAIISPTQGHCRILGINTNGTEFTQNVEALIDGFDVTPNGNAKITAPVLKIRPLSADSQEPTGGLKMAIRNIAVHGWDASESDINIADINNALLYDVLMHSNKVKDGNYALMVGANGYVVNATVEGSTLGADGATPSFNHGAAFGDNVAASHVFNSLTNFDKEADLITEKTLSGYCYKVEDNNLNYQLTEMSKHIDECDQTQAACNPTVFLPTQLQGFINYGVTRYDEASVNTINTALANYLKGDRIAVKPGIYASGDRDLLGNFRLLDCTTAKKIDRGCFETWKVEEDYVCNFPGYPHDGSVEYIMAGKSLVIDPFEGEDADESNMPHNPAFVLLQEGANFYGNGRNAVMSYVAVERKLDKTHDATVVAMPYTMDYIGFKAQASDSEKMATSVGVGIPSYDENGVISIAQDRGNAYTYNGAKRAEWKYDFASSKSPCWELVLEGNKVAAAQGVLYEPSVYNNETTSADAVLRFTGRGDNLFDYIYREDIETGGKAHFSKDVVLKKYDDSESTAGGADFTDADDQGWNCIGIPYLVSDYRPYQKVKKNNEVQSQEGGSKAELNPAYNLVLADDGEYLMATPHELWLYYNGTTPNATEVNGKGGFYSVNSWSDAAADWHLAEGTTPTTWVGEGFFIQNRKFSGDEQLKFWHPVYTGTAIQHNAPYNTRFYYTDGIEETTNGNSDRAGERVIKYV